MAKHRLYGIAFADTALKALEGIPKRFRRLVVNKAKALTGNSKPNGCKRIVGTTDNGNPIYRVRSGDYRILYAIRDDGPMIVVLDIGHRKDIYRRMG